MAINLLDITSNNNDLTNNGSVGEWTSSTPFAGSTIATEFTRTSGQCLSATDSASLSITGDMTIEAWVLADTLVAGQNTVCGKMEGLNNKRSYLFRVEESGILSIYVSADGSSATGKSSTTTISTGSWVHIAVSYDASEGTAQFYKNATAIEEVTGLPTSIHDNDSLFRIGNFMDSSGNLNYCWDGKIDEVRVWNDIRTPTEIANNYNVELTGSEANLVAYWAFEEIITTNIKKVSGVAYASIKKISGVSLASIKKISGVA